MDTKKIMFVLPRMNSGGVERFVSILANNLANRHYSVTVVVLVANDTFYNLNDKVEFISANIPLDRSSILKRKISLAKGFATSVSFVRKIVAQVKPSIVIPFLTHCELVCYLATLGNNNIKRLSSERSDPRQRSFFIRKFKEFVYRTSSLLICQSRNISDYFEHIPKEKKCVIPNPFDRALLPEPVREAEPLKIVSIGRLTSVKNFPLLIKAFSQIADEFKDITLTIYGEGPKRSELESIIDDLKLNGRVFLPGSVADVHNRIKDSALFVLPSDYEGFPNALLEAIALKIPVISTDFASGVAREIVTEKFGIIVPCKNEHAMAGAMRRLLYDDELRNQIRTCSREELNKYDVDNVVGIWDSLLTNIVKQDS